MFEGGLEVELEGGWQVTIVPTEVRRGVREGVRGGARGQ